MRSQMGIESDCLRGQLKTIFEISDSDAGLKVEKSGLLQVEEVNVEIPVHRNGKGIEEETKFGYIYLRRSVQQVLPNCILVGIVL